jgi:hypothetical protein
MFKITFEKVPESMTTDDVVLHNLRESDKYLHLQMFIISAQAWFSNNKGKSFQELEKYLRDNNFNTHLIAKEPTTNKVSNANNYYLMSPDTKKEDETLKYECIYSCRPKEYALKELKEHSASYEENFKKLKVSGQLGIRDDKTIDEDFKEIDEKTSQTTKKLSEKEKTHVDFVTECKKLIKIEESTSEDILQKVLTQIKERFGKEPNTALVSMGKGPIFGFTINNKIVSNVGFTIYHNETGKKVTEVVELSL